MHMHTSKTGLYTFRQQFLGTHACAVITQSMKDSRFSRQPLNLLCSANVDLNRAWPDRNDRGGLNLTATGNEPAEVLALMHFATAFPFSAGCNMHEGALVANYPWDGDRQLGEGYAAAPDDAAFVALAKAFAGFHGTMAAQHADRTHQPAVRAVHNFLLQNLLAFTVLCAAAIAAHQSLVKRRLAS